MLLLTLVGCLTTIVDRFTADRIMHNGMQVAETHKACELGVSLSHVIGAFNGSNKQPDLAFVIADGTAAICAQHTLWEAEIQAARIAHNQPLGTPGRVAEIKDAQIRSRRGHALVASRFYKAFQHTEKAFGPVDSDCSGINPKDELVYLIGLVSGTLAVLHDKSSGHAAVPVDVLTKVARGASCLDNETWWYAPQALEGAVWGMIPGSGPADVDAWEHLRSASLNGQESGVRVAWGIAALIASTAGKEEFLQEVLIGHGASMQSTSQNSTYAFFDQYGFEISLHHSDLLWTSEKGHRTPALGQLPVTKEVQASPINEGADPFGADPFDETPSEEGPVQSNE